MSPQDSKYNSREKQKVDQDTWSSEGGVSGEGDSCLCFWSASLPHRGLQEREAASTKPESHRLPGQDTLIPTMLPGASRANQVRCHSTFPSWDPASSHHRVQPPT